jgi:TonB family protein
MSNCTRCLLVLAYVIAAPGVAQPAGPEVVDAVPIRAGSRIYPEGAAERGVQGTVTIHVQLSPEGVFSNPVLHESSRSEELDAAAMALAPRLKYTPPDVGAALPTELLVPIEFRKDSLETLGAKTCTEFNVDAAYFAETFPELPLTDMAVFDLVMGVLAFRVEAKQREELARILPQIRQDMIAACRDAPASRFVEHALKAIE